MGDRDDGHVGIDLAQLVHDLAFGFIIKGRACLIQQQNDRLCIERPGHGNALALPSRQLQATLANPGFELLWHGLDTLNDRRTLG